MKISECLIRLALLLQVVLCDQTCDNGRNQIKVSTESGAYSFEIDGLKSFGVGIWTRFLPYLKEHKLDDPNSFIIYQARDNLNRKVVEYRLNLSTGMAHQFFLSMSDSATNWFEFAYSKVYNIDITFEGGWVLGYQLVDLEMQEQYFYLYLAGTPVEKVMIFARPIYENRISRHFVVSDTFPGQKSELIFNDNIPVLTKEQFQQYAYGCTLPVTCQEQTVVNLIDGVMLFKNKIVTSTIFCKTPKYLVRGWIKLDKFTMNTVVMRMSLNNPYEFDKYLGDRAFYLEYIKGTDTTKDGFDFNTYSYSIPYYVERITYSGDQYSERGNSYAQDFFYWHYFEFQYGMVDNLPTFPRFYMYFSNGNRELTYTFNQDRYHMSEGILYVSIGGDNYSLTKLDGQLANFELVYCVQENSLPKRKCHYSCETCNGPDQYQCTSCGDSSTTHRVLQNLVRCDCQENYFELEGLQNCIDLQTIVPNSKYVTSSKDQQGCEFGYFQVYSEIKSICLKCPQSWNSEIYLCADCLSLTKTWYLNPVCTYDYQLYEKQQTKTYQMLIRNQNQVELYLIDKNEPNLCEGCFNICTDAQISEDCFLSHSNHLSKQVRVTCRQGFYGSIVQGVRQVCHPCPNNCIECKAGICTSCTARYTVDLQGTCLECPLNCATCKYPKDIRALQCMACDAFFALSMGVCYKCGQYCQSCEFQFVQQTEILTNRCLTCIDNSRYFISSDAQNCMPNEIRNCIYAYQQSNSQNTIDTNFTPINMSENSSIIATTRCALCRPKYRNYYEDSRCQFNSSLNDNDQGQYIGGKWPKLVNKIVLCDLSQCKFCADLAIRYCLSCNEGYYSTCINGRCIKCPPELNCATCTQQNKKYADAWKWEVKIYYGYVISNTDYVFKGSKNEEDYEVFCNTCMSGYELYQNKCILSCPITCKQCIIIDGQNQCIECWLAKIGPNQSVTQLSCLECPDLCTFCAIRADEEISVYNPLFNPDNNKLKKYSYLCYKPIQAPNIVFNNDFGVYINCKTNTNCQNKLEITINVYCNEQDFVEQANRINNIDEKANFLKANVKISELFSDDGHFKYIETSYLFEALNSKSITGLVYHLEFISSSTQCQFPKSASIKTRVQKNVFSFNQSEIIMSGSDETIFVFQDSLSIYGFHTVRLTNFKISLVADTKFNIFNIQQSSVYLQNILINTEILSDNQKFYIQVQNPSLIDIRQLRLTGFTLQNLNSLIVYQFDNPKLLTLSYKIVDLYFSNMILINSTLFRINNGGKETLNNYIEFSNCTIQAQLINSQILLSDSDKQSRLRSIMMKDLIFSDSSSSQNSSIFNVQGIQTFSLENFYLNNWNFIGNTSAILTNTISNFTNLTIRNCKIENGTIISNQVLVNQPKTAQYYFSQLEFADNTYENKQAFLSLVQVSYQFLVVNITNLTLIRNNVEKDQWYMTMKASSTLSIIYINAMVINLNYINIIRGIGYSEFTLISNTYNNLDSTQVILNEVQAQLDENINVFIHFQLECYSKFNPGDAFMPVFYFQDIQTIYISAIDFHDLVVFNNGLLYFQATDSTILNLIENIHISNSYFKGNLLVTSESRASTSLIIIISEVFQNIQLSKLRFRNNILHYYTKVGLTTISSNSLLIYSPNSNVIISESKFISNYVSTTMNSNNYIRANSVVITNCQFFSINVFDYKLFKKVILWSFENNVDLYEEELEELFPVHSNGGCAQIYAQSIRISQIRVSNSYARQGGALYIMCEQNCNLQIANSSFFNTQSSLDPNQKDSNGGGILITGIDVIAQIIDSKFSQCYSRRKGGCIYVDVENFSQFLMNNTEFQDSYSMDGSAFYQSTQLNQTTILTNLEFTNSKTAFENYLGALRNLTSIEIYRLRQTNALISISNANIKIENCTFSNLFNIGIIRLSSPSSLIMKQVSINSVVFVSHPLIELHNITDSVLENEFILTSLLVTNCESEFEYINNDVVEVPDLSRKEYNICYDNNANLPVELIQFRNREYQDKLTIYNMQILMTNQYLLSSLITMDYLGLNSYFMLSNSKFNRINCSACNYGIIAISNVQNSVTLIDINVKIQAIVMSENTCGSTSCLIISKQPLAQVPQASQSHNRMLNTYDIEQRLQQFNDIQVVIYQSRAIENNATFSGFLLIGLNTLINQCEFVKNSVTQAGGAIYYKSIDNSTLNIISSVISDNLAARAGGIYLEDYVIQYPFKNEVLLESNTATEFGDNLVEFPSSLTISIDGKQSFRTFTVSKDNQQIIDQIQISQTLGGNKLHNFIMLPSGQVIEQYNYFDTKLYKHVAYNLTLRVIPLNKYNKQMKALSGTTCTVRSRIIDEEQSTNQIAFSSNYTSLDTIDYNETTQDYNFGQMIIKFSPAYTNSTVLQLEFQCSAIKLPIWNESFPYNIIGYIPKYSLRVNIKTFDCQIGEYQNLAEGTCIPCDASQQQFLVRPNTKCEVKDDVSTISVTSTKMQLKQGFWRPFNDSNIVENCFNYLDNCLGGWETGDTSCYQGHIGALCEQCDLYNIRGDGSFSVSSPYECGSCDEVSGNILTIILISVWTMVSIFLSVKDSLTIIQFSAIKSGFIAIGFRVCTYRNSQSAVLMKIFTNYLQIVASITTFQLQLPHTFSYVVGSIGNPISTMAYSYDCFLISISSIEIIYFRTIWSFIMPFIYLAIFFVFYGALLFTNKVKYTFSVIMTTLIYLYIYLQPSLIGGLISLLSYRTLSSVKWILANVSYQYDTEHHFQYIVGFVLPSLLIVGLVIPIFLYYNLYRQKSKLNDVKVRKSWGYLYNEYKDQAYFWEIIKIGERELIIIFLSIYEEKIIVKASLTFIVIFVYFQLAVSYKPFQLSNMNMLDIYSALVCAISIILGSTIYSASSSDTIEIVWPFYLLLVLINIHFILKIMVQMFAMILYEKQAQIDKIRDKINDKFPSIQYSNKVCKLLLTNQTYKRNRVLQNFRKIHDYLIPIARGTIKRKEELQTLLTSQRSQIYRENDDQKKQLFRKDREYSI